MQKFFFAGFIEKGLKNIFLRAFMLKAKKETSRFLALLDLSRSQADFRALTLIINDSF